ncbi:MAG: hypothetical protein ABIJ00_06945 [Candidatus Eisenbacteria bacterium]
MAQRRDVPERQIKQAINALPDVGSCKIEFGEDGTIDAVHIVSRSKRAPKQIVRDVESVLLADFGVKIDHRKVSVAQLDPEQEQMLTKGTRPRFVSMKFAASAGRGRCEVVLERDDLEVTGEASGVAAGLGRLRLIARATFHAVEKLLEERVEFELLDVIKLSAGGREALIALATCVHERGVKDLAGCVQFDEDEQEAAALAALDACNRIVEITPQAERIEYEVTPFDET